MEVGLGLSLLRYRLLVLCLLSSDIGSGLFDAPLCVFARLPDIEAGLLDLLLRHHELCLGFAD